MYIHSPFIFGLSNNILAFLNEKDPQITVNYREYLTSNTSRVSLFEKDGSSFDISISLRYQKTSISSKYGKMLRGIQNFLDAKNILELGTSLGVSALYFDSNASIINTIDMNDIGRKMIQNFSDKNKTDLSNLHFHIGTFEKKLPEVLLEMKKVDLAFVDGDHTYLSTIKNVKNIIPFLSENSCIILDDIRWNKEMYTAWEELNSNSIFNYTIDFGRIGILCRINNHAPKQHFIINL